MAAAWSRRFLIGAELPPCNLIGAPSHMTPLPYLLSAAESLLLPSSSPAPQFPVATFSQPLFGVFCDPRKDSNIKIAVNHDTS